MGGKHRLSEGLARDRVNDSRLAVLLPGIRKVFRGKLVRYLVATILFLLLFLAASGAWKVNLYRPIMYWGDALEMASYHGLDYVFNDLRERSFAPFGVEVPSRLRYASNLLFQPNATLFLAAYLVTQDAIASVNLYYLLTFPLAFLCAYWVYGRLKLPDPFRFGSATLFALMPYHFQRSLGHLMESSYFLVPLLAYMTLLVFAVRPYFHSYRDGAWRWSWKEKRDWLFLGVLVFLVQINEYHQFFFMMLLGIAALIASIQRRSYHVLAGAAILLGAAALSTVAKMVLNNLAAEPELGLSVIGTPISGYGEAEVYGLKMIQVFLPVGNHRLGSFDALRGIYNSAHVVNENSTVALGLLGAVGFGYLVARGVYAIIAKRPNSRILDLCSLLTLCCVLIATVGGGASLIATFGNILFGPESLLTQVRCYNRIIVFIAFFSYYAGSVLVRRLALRASARATGYLRGKIVAGMVALPIFAFALWDQVPFQITNSPDGSKRHASDKRFFSEIEAQLPPRSRIFQFPFNIHHFDVHQSRLPYNYADGIRPYLNSRTLRFTYGGDNGSPQITWLEETSALPPQEMIQRLCEYDFSGILVHRKLFRESEEAAKFEAQLRDVLGPLLQESTDQDFSFAPLSEFCVRQRVEKFDLSAERLKLSRDDKPADGIEFSKRDYPNFLAEVRGVSGREPWGRWTIGPVAKFRFKQALPKTFTLEIIANAFGPNTGQAIKVRVGGVEKSFIIAKNTSETYRLAFETDGTADSLEIIPPKPTGPNEIDSKRTDHRKLGIALISLKIKD